MFRRKEEEDSPEPEQRQTERITSVLGDGTIYLGKISGQGGVRIEGAFEGEIALQGTLVIGTTGKVNCEDLRANEVIIAGALRGNITAEKVEIRSSGRIWGDVKTTAFSTEEGAFLQGNIQMEENIQLDLPFVPSPAIKPMKQDEIPIPSTEKQAVTIRTDPAVSKKKGPKLSSEAAKLAQKTKKRKERKKTKLS